MVTSQLVAELTDHMPADSVLFLQSDVEQCAMQMADAFAACGGFRRINGVPQDKSESSYGAASEHKAMEPIARPRPTVGKDYATADVGGGEWENQGAAAVDGSYQWLPENPLGLMSERESSVISRGQPIFRALFQRTRQEG